MSSFSTCGQGLAACPPDPTKHVQFTEGMVLGVDDFQQEFAYLAGHLQWLARDGLGYGTLAGLHVAVRDGSRGPEVAVSPGVALTPRGELVHVCRGQCASLNDWLTRAEIAAQLPARRVTEGSPPRSRLHVYVTLCFRECPTDQVPVTGQPCRDESELMAASRLQDDFDLELRFDPPDQSEEMAIRELAAWLRSIPIVRDAGTPLPEFLQALRGAFRPTASPSPTLPSSPPADLTLPGDQRCAYFKAALRVWVTEIRPERQSWFLAGTCGCACNGEGSRLTSPAPSGPESCLLLAELVLDLDAGGTIAATQIQEDLRPCLGSLRLIQEWLLCGEGAREEDCGQMFATLFAAGPATLVAWMHHEVPLNVPPSAVTVEINGTAYPVASVSPVGGMPDLLRIQTAADSPPIEIAAGQGLTVRFDTTQIIEAVSPEGHTLDWVLDHGSVCYLGRKDSIISVHIFVPVSWLGELLDVDTTGAISGKLLRYLPSPTDATDVKWRPADLALDDLSDVSTAGADVATEQILLRYNGTGWQAAGLALDDLTDVSTAGASVPTERVLLKYNGTGWQPAGLSLNELLDVTLAGLTADQILAFNGRQWTNQSHLHALNDLTDVDTGTDLGPPADAGSFPVLMRSADGTWRPMFHTHTLDDLTDVVVDGDPKDGNCRCLCFDPNEGVWRLKECDAGDGLVTHSGVAIFEGVRPGAAIISKPIQHRFTKNELVMIRLAPVWAKDRVAYSEDTMALTLDTLTDGKDGFVTDDKTAPMPRVVAKIQDRSDTFQILLKDTRTDDALPEIPYTIRWYAVPMVDPGKEESVKYEELKSSDNRGPRDVIRAGPTVPKRSPSAVKRAGRSPR